MGDITPTPPAPSGETASGVRLLLRALRYRNYRLFFFGQGISVIGTWMQITAMSWLVYRLTHSAFMLGAVGFVGQVPVSLLTPFAGVLADRWERRRMLLVTQSLAALQALVLGALVLTGTVAVWHIVALALFAGIVGAFDMPIRQSFVVDMVEDRADLGNAIALNSSLFNGARLIGPTVAGVLIAAAGEGPCFLINALSFVAVLIALVMMRLAPRAAEAPRPPVLRGLREGFAYAFGFPAIRSLLLFQAAINLLVMPYTVLMPVFAKDVLGGGAHTFGFLVSASGVGSVSGALYLASRRSVRGLARRIALFTVLVGLMLLAFSQSHWLALSLGILPFLGFGMMVQMAACNTILQTIVDDDKRGRVMSLYVLSFGGVSPFGALLAGSTANAAGAPATVLMAGVCCLAAAALFTLQLPAFRQSVRPVYARLGIIPDPSEPISSDAEFSASPEEEPPS